MNRNSLFGTVILLAASLTANASPKDDLASAAKQLADKPNYGWTATVADPSSPFPMGPTQGKTEKGGVTHVTMSFGENSFEIALKGTGGAGKGQEGWQSIEEVGQAEGPGRFLAMMARSTKTPAATATELAGATTELKLVDGAYAGDLTADGVKAQLNFGGGPGGEGPAVTNPKGAVKFWVKDGVLVKFEFKLQAAMNFNGNDMNIDRTTTIEIKDVGTTKIELPADAKKKLP